jgi:hypothetical protein
VLDKLFLSAGVKPNISDTEPSVGTLHLNIIVADSDVPVSARFSSLVIVEGISNSVAPVPANAYEPIVEHPSGRIIVFKLEQ